MIEQLTNPNSIAIIGASSDEAKIGYQILNNLKSAGFKGSLYPVNPKGGQILGLNVCQSISEIGEVPSLVIIVIPSKFVKDSVIECANKGIKSIIIITAGFSETGADGKVLEEEIKSICVENNIALLGPNCLGLINSDIQMNATFAGSMPKAGHISFISQSGAIISSMIDWSKNATIGFSKIFSLGNKALLKEADLLEYLYNDENTDIIMGYIERLSVDNRLTEVLRKYSKTKPTIILFGGKSAFGAKAAASHTGSIVSSYIAVKTYLEQSGVILAESLEELLLFAQIFSSYKSIGGKNVAIITNAGGPGIAASDALAKYGLKMAELSDETISELGQNLRKEANIKNPIDVLGDANELEYQRAIEIVSKDKNVNGMIAILTPQSSTKIKETAEIIASYSGYKPLISAFVGGESLQEAKKIIEKSGKPCFSYPEEAILSLRTLADFGLNTVEISLAAEKTSEIFQMSKKTEILDKFKLPILKYFESSSLEELIKFANEIGYPVVLKTADPTAHKSDSGGLVLNIMNGSDLKIAFEKVGAPAIVGKMVKGKFEILLGIKKDENVGTNILFGTGGIYSEIYKDFSYRVAPITKDIALEMIHETKIGEILNGARGQYKFDLDSLAETIVNAAEFADSYSNIVEVDFNPIIAAEDGYYAVDVRVITK